MSVSLTALLAHPDWAGVRRLGGPDAGPDVTDVLTVSDLHGNPDGASRRLVGVLGTAPRDDWHVDVLLRRAVAAGAVAVLLPGTAALHPASRQLADRIRLPVLGAEDPLAATLLVSRLVHQGREVLVDLVARTASTCAESRAGTDDLLAELVRVWRRPAWLRDAAGAAVAGPAPETPDADTLLVEVAVGPENTGITLVAALPPGSDTEAEALRAALGVAAGAVRQRLAEQRLAVERDARLRTALLSEILADAPELPAAVRRRALDAGWALEGWHVGIRVDVPLAVDVVAARDEVLRGLEAANLRAVVVEHGAGWSAWTTFAHEPAPEELNRHAGATRRGQRRLRTSLPTSTGVGRVHRGATGLARTLGEASDAARLASERDSSGRFVHVDRLGLGQLLLAWTRTDTFLQTARSLLEPLQGNPGDLLTTLTTYLDAESSLTETAAVLGVHRNTVTARIARIRDLLGVDLTDPDERLALHLACRSMLFHS